MKKEEIVLKNKELGIQTIFSSELESAGKVEGKVVYINDTYEDIETINKHETLHLFENSKQFKKIKDILLNILSKEELNELRKEYKEIYYELYKNEENIDEIIDNEIVIDIIVKNIKCSINIDDVIKNCYETIVNSKETLSISKRYLNITLSKKIEQNYPNLTKWEKIFVLNYYSKGLPNGKDKHEIIRKDIKEELQKLYDFSEVSSNFEIDYLNNKELEREVKGEIEAAKANGDNEKLVTITANYELYLKKKAESISKTLQAEYKHIVDFIKTSDYEDAFKCLILKETLSKVYKQEKIKEESETIISKRELNKSIAGHMTLNEIVLDTIYNNLDNYDSFANLYYAGIAIFNNKISAKGIAKIEGLNTYEKGKWIKFDSKTSDPNGYIENAQKLSSLVQDTPWCTKTLASKHLEQGDFYVFVDNNNKPRVAVKMNGNEIDEVRGLKNGNAQELEEEYRDVAIDFLINNKGILHGKEWLEKEEWNKRLIEYNKKLDHNSLTDEDVIQLVEDITEYKDYKPHFHENANKVELINRIKNNSTIIKAIEKKYNCDISKVYFGNLSYRQIEGDVFPYEVVIGNLEFANAKNIDMSRLRVVAGDCNLINSQITKVQNLEKIIGNANFKGSKIAGLSKLKVVKGNLFCGEEIFDLNSLQYIGGGAYFTKSIIESMDNLEYIGGSAYFRQSLIESLSKLKFIGNNADFCGSSIMDLSSLEIVGAINLENTNIKEMPNIIEIKRKIILNENSKILDFIKKELIKNDRGYTRISKKSCKK